jgi:hypothetical protein
MASRRGPNAAPRDGTRVVLRARLLGTKELQCELRRQLGPQTPSHQLELALDPPTPASSFKPRVRVCTECERWGYHLVGCSGGRR